MFWSLVFILTYAFAWRFTHQRTQKSPNECALLRWNRDKVHMCINWPTKCNRSHLYGMHQLFKMDQQLTRYRQVKLCIDMPRWSHANAFAAGKIPTEVKNIFRIYIWKSHMHSALTMSLTVDVLAESIAVSPVAWDTDREVCARDDATNQLTERK